MEFINVIGNIDHAATRYLRKCDLNILLKNDIKIDGPKRGWWNSSKKALSRNAKQGLEMKVQVELALTA